MPILYPTRRSQTVDAQPGLPQRGLDAGMVLVWINLVLGAGTIGYAMSQASIAGENDRGFFEWFWLGMLGFLIPAAWKLIKVDTRDIDRYFIVVAVGVFSVLPKFLGYPGRPAFFDEYAHWTQVERLYGNGLLFAKNNQVVVIGDYPAMHTAATSIRHLTGLETYQTAMCIIVVLHILALLGVFSIGMRVGGSAHVGGLAALLYAVGPGFWYFNTQFAYEAFAIILFIWSTVSIVHLQMASPLEWSRTGWLLNGVLVAFALASAHHLSSYVNLLVLGAFVGASLVLLILRKESSINFVEAVVFFLIVLTLTVWWFLRQAPNTRAYLQPYIEGGFSETLGFLKKADESAPAPEEVEAPRKLFSGSLIPMYEIIVSFMTPVLVLGLAGMSFLIQVKRGMRRSTALAMALISGIYFVVYPMMLSETGAEGARRSWSFTNVGVAVLIALGVQVFPLHKRAWVRLPGNVMVLSWMIILLVGNIAAGTNELYRFPGRYIFGSDTRSVTEEVMETAEWFKATQGPNQGLIADRSNQVAFASRGMAVLGVPSESYPVWDFIIKEEPIGPELLDQVLFEDLRFIVIDKRQVEFIPRTKFYLDQKEPLAFQRVEPVGPGSLTKWDQMPYAFRIYESDNLIIYRLDASAFSDTFTVPNGTAEVKTSSAAGEE